MMNKTIKEFADELGIPKSKVHYQVSKLDSNRIVVLNDFKHQIKQLEMQISIKDEQIATLHNLLDQQQQLQLKTQQMLEEKNLLFEQKKTDSSNAKWYQFLK